MEMSWQFICHVAEPYREHSKQNNMNEMIEVLVILVNYHARYNAKLIDLKSLRAISLAWIHNTLAELSAESCIDLAC